MATSTYDLIVQATDKASGPLGKVDKSLKSIEKTSGGVTKGLGLVSGALAAIGASSLISGIVKTTARFEDLQDTLTSVTGSAEKGAKAFQGIQKFATQTQFGVEELTNTYIKLAGAGIKPTTKLLTTFTDAAAVTTDQIGTLEAITDLFSRTTAGGLGLEELNRLADRGVPVFAILQEKLGLARLEVSEFGKSAEGARKITEALAQGIEERFGGATQDKVDNLSTAMSNFGIAITNAAARLGSQLRPQLTQAITDATNFLEANDALITSLGGGLGQAITVMSQSLSVLAQNIDVVRNAFLTFIAINAARSLVTLIAKVNSFTAAAGGMASFIRAAGTAFRGWLVAIPIIGNIVARFNPLTAVILGAVSAATYFQDTMVNVGDTSASVKEIFQALWSQAGEGARIAADFTRNTWDRTYAWLSDSNNIYIRAVSNGLNDFGRITKDALNFALNIWIAVFETIRGIIFNLPDWFVGALTKANAVVKDFITNIGSDFKLLGSGLADIFSGDFSEGFAKLGQKSANTFAENWKNSAATNMPELVPDIVFSASRDRLGEIGNAVYDMGLKVGGVIAETVTPAMESFGDTLEQQIIKNRAVQQAIEATTVTADTSIPVIEEVNNLWEDAGSNILPTVITGNDELTKSLTKQLTTLESIAKARADQLKDTLDIQKALSGETRDVQILAKQYGISEAEVRDALRKRLETLVEVEDKSIQVANKAKELAERFDQDLKGAVSGFTNQLASDLAKGKMSFASFEDAFNSMLEGILQAIIQKNIMAPLQDQILGFIGNIGGAGGGGIFDMISGLFGGGGGFSFGGIFDGISSFFGGFFADGGRPPVGKPSIVGERGPELFVPSTSGTIVPNEAISGGGGEPLQVVFNINSVSTKDGVEFLLENKPTIVNMIQQASNSRGKRGILD